MNRLTRGRGRHPNIFQFHLSIRTHRIVDRKTEILDCCSCIIVLQLKKKQTLSNPPSAIRQFPELFLWFIFTYLPIVYIYNC